MTKRVPATNRPDDTNFDQTSPCLEKTPTVTKMAAQSATEIPDDVSFTTPEETRKLVVSNENLSPVFDQLERHRAQQSSQSRLRRRLRFSPVSLSIAADVTHSDDERSQKPCEYQHYNEKKRIRRRSLFQNVVSSPKQPGQCEENKQQGTNINNKE